MQVVENTTDKLILRDRVLAPAIGLSLGILVALMIAYGTWKSGQWVGFAVMLAIAAALFGAMTLYVRFTRITFNRPVQSIDIDIRAPLGIRRRQLSLHDITGVTMLTHRQSAEFLNSLNKDRHPKQRIRPETFYCLALIRADGSPPEPLGDLYMPLSRASDALGPINDWLRQALPSRRQ